MFEAVVRQFNEKNKDFSNAKTNDEKEKKI